MWRATLLASVLVLVLASFHVLLAGGVGPGVTDQTLEQVSEPGSSGQAGTLSFGKESTDCVVECQCDGATDVYTPRRDHHSERTREDTPPRHVLDSAPLSDLYRNRHFFDRATESTSREQRWSSILSVLGAIRRRWPGRDGPDSRASVRTREFRASGDTFFREGVDRLCRGMPV